MNTLLKFINPFPQATPIEKCYEAIENALVNDQDFKGLNVSGSLFSLTTFRNVVFQSCVFFASNLENCEFVSCTFIDCNFQFSTVEYCNFSNTLFRSCKWDITPIKKCNFNSCDLDYKTIHYSKNGQNKFDDLFEYKKIKSFKVRFLNQEKNKKVA